MQDSEADSTLKIREALGCDVLGFERLGGGRNSRVYKVDVAGTGPIVAKFYFKSPSDSRDRLSTEFNAFKFLSAEGIGHTPMPLSMHPENGFALYEYIEGTSVDTAGLSEGDIDAAAAFLTTLFSIPEAKAIGTLGSQPASEAFFSLDEIAGNIDGRISVLNQAKGTADVSRRLYTDLGRFLADDLTPSYLRFKQAAEGTYGEIGMTPETAIPAGERVLSPSDFGFHNAILDRKGEWIFLDFEYFGWDDPVKTLADFSLHPAMKLPERLNKIFFEKCLRIMGWGPGFRRRYDALRPLFGIKWCVILLNEFVRQDLARRVFASSGNIEYENLLENQLNKAKDLLNLLCRS